MLKKIRKFVSDNWLVITLAIIPSAALWFFFQREVHDLQVEVVSQTPVVSLAEGFSDDIEVLYKSQKIESLNVIDIEIANTGNRAIEKGDYETPITMEFSGRILSKPNVIKTNPSSLNPVIKVETPEKASIEPMLLNGDDNLVVRYFVTDLDTNVDWIKVNARIKNIKQVVIDLSSSKLDGKTWNFVLGILSSLLASVSMAAILILFRRARWVVRIADVPEIVFEVSKRLEAESEVVNHAEELANKLNIKGHDYKSNFLLLRLKIESLLRELAISVDLPRRMQFGSISRISSALEERQIITHDIAAAIRDLSPAMNRELHEIETYVADDQFEMLQQLGLNIVAALDSIIERRSPEEQAT